MYNAYVAIYHCYVKSLHCSMFLNSLHCLYFSYLVFISGLCHWCLLSGFWEYSTLFCCLLTLSFLFVISSRFRLFVWALGLSQMFPFYSLWISFSHYCVSLCNVSIVQSSHFYSHTVLNFPLVYPFSPISPQYTPLFLQVGSHSIVYLIRDLNRDLTSSME